MSASNLQITGLCKRYGDFVPLAPGGLDVAQGEFLTLLGPSGSGKTTLLSLIAGLAQPDDGQVRINGVDVTYGAPYERDIGMVFQNYALFPHMTVAENVSFPLQMRKTDAKATRDKVMQALEMVHLPHLAGRYPRELSGGAAADRTRALHGVQAVDHPDGRTARRARQEIARPDAVG